jgi:regulator of sigma E protease
MTDNPDNEKLIAPAQQESGEPSKPHNPVKSLVYFLIVLVGLSWFVIQDPVRAKNICLMLLGFGAVIFVHELGHFAAGKLFNIECEAFSLGFYTLFGIKRVQGGFRMRFLPSLLGGKDGKSEPSFVIPRAAAKEGETEYRLGLIPLGGYVKLLGQEDIGADQPSNNPRAFGNKPVWQRVIVIAAGVFMNIVSAAIVFMIVFGLGLNRPPAIVGSVQPDMPAAQAGILPGDEILAIDGKEKIDFKHLIIAAAFADEGEQVPLKVRHPDGTIETIGVESKLPDEQSDVKRLGIRFFGIGQATTLTIPEEIENEEFLERLHKIGFEPGDTFVAIDGSEISRGDQFDELTSPKPGVIPADKITFTVERKNAAGETARRDVEVPMQLVKDVTKPEKQQGQILGLVPRLRVVDVVKEWSAEEAGVQKDDIILRFGTLNNPTHSEMTEYCQANDGKAIDLVVQRLKDGKPAEKSLQVTPKQPPKGLWDRIRRAKSNAIIGVSLLSDMDQPIVADCRDLSDDYKALVLPRGAIIQTVAGQDVKNWQDVLKALLPLKGKDIEITYHTPDQQLTQSLTAKVPDNSDWIGFVYRPDFGNIAEIPFEPMMRIYKGENLLENIRMGADITYSNIAHTYLFIRGMIKGTISYKVASGPIGIMKMSYTVASKQTLAEYCFFIAMISVAIAVFNFLPLPVLDGGLIVLMIVEKIKGSPLSLRTQTIIATTSWIFILGLFVLITWQDIIKVVTGVL